MYFLSLISQCKPYSFQQNYFVSDSYFDLTLKNFLFNHFQTTKNNHYILVISSKYSLLLAVASSSFFPVTERKQDEYIRTIFIYLQMYYGPIQAPSSQTVESLLRATQKNDIFTYSQMYFLSMISPCKLYFFPTKLFCDYRKIDLSVIHTLAKLKKKSFYLFIFKQQGTTIIFSLFLLNIHFFLL